jgi:hypothetical protein
MMLFDSKPEPTRISLQLPDQLVEEVRGRKKRRRASEASARAAYYFDTDAEADARDAALTAVASLAGRVDEALRRLNADEDDDLRPVPVLREAVAPYLEDGAAAAHDATLRAFFAPAAEEKGEEHVPTMALWALASIGRAYPERMMPMRLSADKEKEEFAAQAYGYYTALHVALYTRRPETFYARRHFIRGASERLAEVLEAQGGGDNNVRKWLLPRR